MNDAEERTALRIQRAQWMVTGSVFMAAAYISIALFGLGLSLGPWPLGIPGAVAAAGCFCMGWLAGKRREEVQRDLMAMLGEEVGR